MLVAASSSASKTAKYIVCRMNRVRRDERCLGDRPKACSLRARWALSEQYRYNHLILDKSTWRQILYGCSVLPHALSGN